MRTWNSVTRKIPCHTALQASSRPVRHIELVFAISSHFTRPCTRPSVWMPQPLPQNPFPPNSYSYAPYETALRLEIAKPLHGRVLGYVLIYAPPGIHIGRNNMARDMISCEEDDGMLEELADLYINHLLRCCTQAVARRKVGQIADLHTASSQGFQEGTHPCSYRTPFKTIIRCYLGRCCCERTKSACGSLGCKTKGTSFLVPLLVFLIPEPTRRRLYVMVIDA